jgi:2-(1,2-epoxy-1,2-dihydrophenyl)acetyl-CoA isomerase
MSDTLVKLERNGAIATVTLNRPDTGNAVNTEFARALMAASTACDEDETIRCVILTGAGRMFCVGGDIAAFIAAGDSVSSYIKELTAYVHMAVSRFSRMNKPLITAINGAAAGAGFSLAVMGDIALAARSAKLTTAYGNIGLSPDGGTSWLLPRLVGLRRAQELVLTNRRVSAEEAVTLGLVTRVVEDHALADEAMAVAAQFVKSATRAIGRTRNLLLASFSNSLEEHMELEARSTAQSGRDPEGREGMAAFFAKRPPNFPA